MNIKKVTKTVLSFFIILTIGLVVNNVEKVKAETITDGKVTVDIADYNPTDGWLVGETKTAKISIDFEDATSADKTVTINLPDGIRYVSYPSLTPATSGNLSLVEAKANETLSAVMASNTSATPLSFSPNSYRGEVTYNFKPTAEKVEFSVVLTVDENVYYGPKDFALTNEMIKVDASKANTSIGSTELGVKAIDSTSNPVNFLLANTGTTNQTPTALKGSTAPIKIGAEVIYRPGFLYPKAFFAKEYEHHLYYPSVDGIKAINVSGSSGSTISDDNNGEVIVSQSKGGANTESVITFSLDVSGADVGKYYVSNTVYATTYDGKKVSATRTNWVTVTIVDQLNEKLTTYYGDKYYDDIADNYQQALPYTIVNDLMSAKENYYLEITPGANMNASEVVIPNDVIDVKYKTNLNNNYTTITKADLIKANSPRNEYYALNKNTISLNDGEYFTSVIVSLDNLAEGAILGHSNVTYVNYLRVLATLKDGIDSENLSIKTYKLDESDQIVASTLTEKVPKLTRKATLASATNRIAPATTVDAGTTKRVTLRAQQNFASYNASYAMLNPTLYLKLPTGVTINPNTVAVTITGESQPVQFEVSDVYEINGEKYLEIDVDHTIGGFFDNAGYAEMAISFDISASIFSGGNYNWASQAFLFDKSEKTVAGTFNGESSPTVDVNDINRNGKTDDSLLAFRSSTFNVIPKRELLIDTYLKESTTAEKSPEYDPSNANSAVDFTPGTEAAYYVEVYNNRNDAVGVTSKVTSYIPVPKKDLDFGTDFQTNPGYWNMKLGSAIPVIKVYDVNPLTGEETDVSATRASNYHLEYSTDATASNYQSATYSTTMDEDATMIRLVNNDGIEMQEKAVIEFIYVVDEDAQSVIDDPSKLGKINDFRPYYRFESAGTAGWTSGTRVGAELVIGEISGIVFGDVDTNGLYQTGDTKLKDIEVSLMKLGTDNNYAPYIDPQTGVQAVAKTDANGVYKFTNLPNGRYKIDFSKVVADGGVFTPKNIGNNYKIDSDVEQAGTLVGTAQNIDPTQDSSKYIYAGLSSYNPPVDLKLTTDESKTINILAPLDGTGAQNSKNVKVKIEPTFFETISDKTYDGDGIKVESNDATKATASANGILANKGTYLETTLNITGVSQGSTTVTISIKDVYGQTREIPFTVNVLANSRPVISASNQSVEAGNTTFNLANLATITDAEDGSNGLSTKIKSDGGFDVNKVGEYTVVYESITPDKDNNLAIDKTIKVIVVDTTKPVAVINVDRVLNPTSASVTGSDNAQGTLTYTWEIVNSSNTKVSDGTTSAIILPTADGVYTIKAKVNDASGNASDEVTKTITIDKTKPVITTTVTEKRVKIGSGTPVDLKAYFGLSASDAIDSSVNASKVSVSNNINVNKVGTYKVTFEVSDAAGNVQVKEVNFIVEAISISGVVFEDANYNSQNDDTAKLAGVSLSLIDNNTNAVLATTTTNNLGVYSFSIPNGSETTTNYSIKVTEKIGYLLANKGTDSIVDITSLKSDVMTLSGADYTNKNIGMAKDVSASLAPTTLKVYVGDTVTSSYSVTNGSKVSEALDNTKASYSDQGNGSYSITGVNPGTATLSVYFKDGYVRNQVTKTMTINVLALPTAQGNHEVAIKGAAIDRNHVFTPNDGIVSYESAKPERVTVDNNGNMKALESGVSIVKGKVTTNDTEAKEAISNIIVAVGENKEPVLTAVQNQGTLTHEVIYAEDFALSYEEAQALEQDVLSDRANSWSTEVHDDWSMVERDTADITIDTSAIDLTMVPDDGVKSFDVTFTGPNGVAIETVKVYVGGQNVIVDNDVKEAINAHDFTIKTTDVKGLSKAKVISLAQARAWNILDNSDVEITSVDYSKVKAQVGTYKVSFTTAKGTTITIEVKVVAADSQAIKDSGEEENITELPKTGSREGMMTLVSGIAAIFILTLTTYRKRYSN